MPPRDGDRGRLDDVAVDSVLLQQAMDPKAVVTGFLDDEDAVDRRAKPLLGFRPQASQELQQRNPVATGEAVLGHLLAARRQHGDKPCVTTELQGDQDPGSIGLGGGSVLAKVIDDARHRSPPCQLGSDR